MLARLTAFALVVLVLLPFTAPFPISNLHDLFPASDYDSSVPLQSVEDLSAGNGVATMPGGDVPSHVRLRVATSRSGAAALAPLTERHGHPAGVNRFVTTRAAILIVLRV